ncbi:CNNM domain-containing protein [candidate division KSB1 bacterium]
MFILSFTVLLVIFISAQCSLYESTLYSTRIATLESIKTKSKKKNLSRKMLQMKRNISSPIAAILILNTIANTAGATVAGMYAHKALGSSLVPLFSIIFTLAILFFAEIIPKTLGAVHWRILWSFTVIPITIMQYILKPLVIVSEKATNIISRGQTKSTMTEDEILSTIRMGATEGEISDWEGLMTQNIINLEKKLVQEIMTPRRVIFALDESMSIADAHKIVSEKGLSRIPIYKDDKENITGYIMIHDLSSAKALSKPDMHISSLAKSISFVPENMNCLTLLSNSLKNRSHITVVQDEYGGVSGIVTLEDLLETILGAEIVDEKDKVVDLQKLARSQKKKRSK